MHNQVVSGYKRIQTYCITCSRKPALTQQKIWKVYDSFIDLFQRLKHLIFITGKHLHMAVTVGVLQVHISSYPLIITHPFSYYKLRLCSQGSFECTHLFSHLEKPDHSRKLLKLFKYTLNYSHNIKVNWKREESKKKKTQTKHSWKTLLLNFPSLSLV